MFDAYSVEVQFKLLVAFDKQGVFQTLEEHLVKNLDHLLVDYVADCKMWMKLMDRCGSKLLSAAGGVLVKKRNLMTNLVGMSNMF